MRKKPSSDGGPPAPTDRVPDGVWQVDEDGMPHVRVGGRKVPLIEDEGGGWWHPVIHRKTRTMAKRYPSNGQPDVNPVRQMAKRWGVSRRVAAERLAALLAAQQREA